jgi:predicted RNA-binding protein with RPS1 domain
MEELVGSGKQDVKKKFPPGTEVQVEIIAIDEKGRIKLSQKSMEDRADRESYSKFLQEKDRNGLGTFGDLLGDLKLDENPKK